MSSAIESQVGCSRCAPIREQMILNERGGLHKAVEALEGYIESGEVHMIWATDKISPTDPPETGYHCSSCNRPLNFMDKRPPLFAWNHRSQLTPASGTSSAGQAPRHT